MSRIVIGCSSIPAISSRKCLKRLFLKKAAREVGDVLLANDMRKRLIE
jgi:hypothetical protein